MKRAVRAISSEKQEQEALFQWAEIKKSQYPELNFMFCIPNGGKRDIVTAVGLARAGVKAGVPDLFFPVARRGYHGLFIEMKVGYNKPTEKQNLWIEFLSGQEFRVAVCYSWGEAARLIENYLGGG